MNNYDNNDYKKSGYGDYRTLERESDAERVDAAIGARIFVNRVYNWMFGGLALSGLAAWGVSQIGPAAIKSVLSLSWLFFIAEFALVIGLSAAINKLSAQTAGVMFVIFSILNGVTLSPIFMFYTQTSIYLVFGGCSLMFAATSAYGYMTKANLATVGSYCMMGLFGLIIATLINFFVKSARFDYILSYIGIAIFVGLTAWDTQKVRMLAEQNGENAQTSPMQKYAILAALELYLDFINLFLYLLRIFGRRR